MRNARLHDHPSAKLRQEHVAVVEALIATHPGLPLAQLTQHVAKRLRIPQLAYATLAKFMEWHGLAILPAERGQSLQAAISALPSVHVDSGAVSARVHRARGLPAPYRPSAYADQTADPIDQARQGAADWLDLETVRRLAAAALLAARRKAWQPIDDEDLDPQDPGSWFRPELFAEDVADLFRLALFRVAFRAGIAEAEHECERLAGLGGAQWLPERGLGQSPREHAEGGGNSQGESSPMGFAGAVD